MDGPRLRKEREREKRQGVAVATWIPPPHSGSPGASLRFAPGTTELAAHQRPWLGVWGGRATGGLGNCPRQEPNRPEGQTGGRSELELPALCRGPAGCKAKALFALGGGGSTAKPQAACGRLSARPAAGRGAARGALSITAQQRPGASNRRGGLLTMGRPSPAISPEPMCVRWTKFMGSPIMLRSILRLFFFCREGGEGHSGRKEPPCWIRPT